MTGKDDTKRYVSSHRLPVSLPLSRASRPSSAGDMPAAFLTQLLNSVPVGAPHCEHEAEMRATSVYRRVESSDRKRMPMGYRKMVSA